MSGQPLEILTGGAGMYAGGSAQPVAATAQVGLSTGVQPHHSLIFLVLVAVAVLFILDRAGFRFAVTAGRR